MIFKFFSENKWLFLFIVEILREAEERSNRNLDTKLTKLRNELIKCNTTGNNNSMNNNGNELPDDSDRMSGSRTENVITSFYYNSSIYSVPVNFEFPSRIGIRRGLLFWFCGSKCDDNGKRIRPFRQITLDQLPTLHLKNQFKLSWRPIFRYFERHCAADDRNLIFDLDWTEINSNKLDTYYESCQAVLRHRVSYCFNKDNNRPFHWLISTWSVRVSN